MDECKPLNLGDTLMFLTDDDCWDAAGLRASVTPDCLLIVNQ